VFDRFFANPYFLVIMGITIVLQVLIVEFGDTFTQTHPLDWKEWLWCIGAGATSLVANQVIRLIPVDLTDGVLVVDSETIFKMDPEFAPDEGDVEVVAEKPDADGPPQDVEMGATTAK